jgi:hypothetical protein
VIDPAAALLFRQSLWLFSRPCRGATRREPSAADGRLGGAAAPSAALSPNKRMWQRRVRQEVANIKRGTVDMMLAKSRASQVPPVT